MIAVTLILLLALLFVAAGVASLKRAKTTVNPRTPAAASSLVSDGIYKISRNPMYVSLALLLVAWSAYLASPASAIGAPGFMLYLNRFQIAPEERALRALFGDEFEVYRTRVRRWL